MSPSNKGSFLFCSYACSRFPILKKGVTTFRLVKEGLYSSPAIKPQRPVLDLKDSTTFGLVKAVLCNL